MSRYRVIARPGKMPPEDIQAWCEGGCDWSSYYRGPDPYGHSKAARRHTATTGHKTTADRTGRSVWFVAVDR